MPRNGKNGPTIGWTSGFIDDLEPSSAAWAWSHKPDVKAQFSLSLNEIRIRTTTTTTTTTRKTGVKRSKIIAFDRKTRKKNLWKEEYTTTKEERSKGGAMIFPAVQTLLRWSLSDRTPKGTSEATSGVTSGSRSIGIVIRIRIYRPFIWHCDVDSLLKSLVTKPRKMPVFHTKTIESILEPVAQQVSLPYMCCIMYNCTLIGSVSLSIVIIVSRRCGMYHAWVSAYNALNRKLTN